MAAGWSPVLANSIGSAAVLTQPRPGCSGSASPYPAGMGPHLSRGSSHRGSSGSSYSETPASMGVPLEESREGRTSITPEFMEELESADTCSGDCGLPSRSAGCPRRGGRCRPGALAPQPAAPCPCCPPALPAGTGPRQRCFPVGPSLNNFYLISSMLIPQNTQPGSPLVSSGVKRALLLER